MVPIKFGFYGMQKPILELSCMIEIAWTLTYHPHVFCSYMGCSVVMYPIVVQNVYKLSIRNQNAR